ncbi:HD domain-containing protein [Streptomyces sp. NPDC021224]|uniref:HD domain-containing protein n=1 Tax=unclassified Streptomyces TaxID=2593676 RepID=UPI0037ACB9F7
MPPTSEPTTAILNALQADTWDQADYTRAESAAALAFGIYSGRTRDQGTPYLHHPVAVVAILRDELAVTSPTTLLLGLLHDALEISPESASAVAAELGQEFAERLREMTPDHRLERRPKQPGDEAAWRAKTGRLGPEPLLVRLTDRIHNLRDLRNSTDSGRRERFVAALVDFYLPLAETSRTVNTHLNAACALLRAEYERYAHETPEVGL